MKWVKYRIRNEILEILLIYSDSCDWEWKRYIGEVWVEMRRVKGDITIECSCFSISLLYLRISGGEVVQSKFTPVGKELKMMRQLLKEIKKDKDI